MTLSKILRPKALLGAYFFFAALATTALPTLSWAQDPAPQKSAYQLWVETLESTLTGREERLRISGTDKFVTYGAEKEGSSGLITRVMGPKAEAFKLWVSALPEAQRKLFLREFLSSWASGSIRVRGVRDATGAAKDFDFSFLRNFNYTSADLPALEAKFDQWLAAAGDRSFSFISEPARMRIFKGTFVAGQRLPEFVLKYGTTDYRNWVPLYGDPEKYLTDAHSTSVGWEINFKPQDSYAAFDKMIDWFQESLKNAGQRFEAPGHQRMIMPKRPNLTEVDRLRLEGQLGEIYRHVQAYILLRGMAGMAGTEVGAHKAVHTDEVMRSLESYRGIIRLERDRFVEDSYGIELRAGTKSDYTRRFTELLIGTRYAAGDFEGIAQVGDWSLIPGDYGANLGTDAEIAARFDVDVAVVTRAKKNIQAAKVSRRNWERNIGEAFVVPFWQWENAPYLSATKRAHLKELTKTFLISVAAWEGASVLDLQKAFATWTKASNLIQDIETYLRPRAPPAHGEALAKIFEYRASNPRAGQIDVNKIDLGIEYSARFPIKLQSGMSEMRLQDGKYAWIETQYDLTQEERAKVLEDFAKTLGQTLNKGRFVQVVREEAGNHGHQFVLAYELKDRQDRTWRVEWDGIGRSYDPDGNVVEGSARGGHIEVVTPKFNPTPEEVNAVFKAFAKHNLVALHMGGGGHINIDLAPFAGNPRALARFLSVFHEHRGVIALMFQHIGRLKSAEPVELSSRLVEQLHDFRGTEAELKALLYNERYFNTRVGRKSRYLQLDVGAYFQDVVPPHLLTQDFDLMNDIWRQNFNVDPRIRKMEFRLFDAPRNEVEAALQVKLVRAMLHQALNETAQLPGRVQKVDHEAYVRNPNQAFSDLRELSQKLGLDFEEYRPMLVEGMATSRDVVTGEGYQPLSTRLAQNPKVQEGWGQAVAPRPAGQAIASEGRVWTGEPIAEALGFDRTRREAQAEAQRLRSDVEARRSQGPRSGVMSREDCIALELERGIVERAATARSGNPIMDAVSSAWRRVTGFLGGGGP